MRWSRWLLTHKHALLSLAFGFGLTTISALALVDQFRDKPEVSEIADLFVGTDCDIRPELDLTPEVEGKDLYDIRVPLNQLQVDYSNSETHFEKTCTRLIVFSHEPFSSELVDAHHVVRTVDLKPLAPLYVMSVDLAALDKVGRLTIPLANLRLPSRWPHLTSDLRTYRMYLQDNVASGEHAAGGVLGDIAKAFGDPAILGVKRSSMRLVLENEYDRELVSSIPKVVEAMTDRHTGARSLPTAFDQVLAIAPDQNSVVIQVRDNNVKNRREVILVIIATFLGIGAATAIEAVAKFLRGSSH